MQSHEKKSSVLLCPHPRLCGGGGAQKLYAGVEEVALRGVCVCVCEGGVVNVVQKSVVNEIMGCYYNINV